jgi:chemotaxis protein MotA
MFFIIGALIVVGGVIGGYMGAGGKLEVLFQPFEVLIIFGAAIGAFIIANPKVIIIGALKSFGPLLKGARYKKESYLELLGVLYSVFKLAKTKGDLALESHVEKPEESSLFQKFPKFASDHHVLVFLCDYLRLLTLGANNSHEIEAIMDQELEVHHHESHAVGHAIQVVADGMPALGIVAAVLGVINTMGSITEPPEVLGHMIGGALVGTFMGVLMAYGFIGPVSSSLLSTAAAEAHYLQAIKNGLVAHMQGYAPQVSIEFSRKSLPSELRPSFAEVEEMIQNIPAD